jgi:hypothetical protein
MIICVLDSTFSSNKFSERDPSSYLYMYHILMLQKTKSIHVMNHRWKFCDDTQKGIVCWGLSRTWIIYFRMIISKYMYIYIYIVIKRIPSKSKLKKKRKKKFKRALCPAVSFSFLHNNEMLIIQSPYNMTTPTIFSFLFYFSSSFI